MTDLARAKPPPLPLPGIAVAAAVVIGIIGWIAIGSLFLSDASLFAGFMTLWYWAKVEHLAMRRLPATILGALVGIGLAFAIYYGGEHYGAAGLAVGLGLLSIAIYLDVIAVIPSVVNASTMLFSIVAAAPLIKLRINWVEFCMATVLGGVFFASYVAGLTGLLARLQSGSKKLPLDRQDSRKF